LKGGSIMSLFNRRIPTMRDHERFNAAPRKDELLEKVEYEEENVVLEEDISATEEFDGYERVGNQQKTLKIREDKPEIEYTFYYQEKE
jgi:hypothetical protein